MNHNGCLALTATGPPDRCRTRNRGWSSRSRSSGSSDRSAGADVHSGCEARGSASTEYRRVPRRHFQCGGQTVSGGGTELPSPGGGPPRHRGAAALAADHRDADRHRGRSHRRRQVDDDRAISPSVFLASCSRTVATSPTASSFLRCRTISAYREHRFAIASSASALTARYRESHPGGMAHALSRLRIDPPPSAGHLIFDGLRGVDEILWAIAHFPRSRFLGLRAPEAMRLLRLLGRHQKLRLRRGAERRARDRSARRQEPARRRSRARRDRAASTSWRGDRVERARRACRSTRSRARRRSWSRRRATTTLPRRCARSRPSSALGGT